jgi:hypothetical protein
VPLWLNTLIRQGMPFPATWIRDEIWGVRIQRSYFLFVGFNQKNILFYFLEFSFDNFQDVHVFLIYGEGIDLFLASPTS